MTWRNAGPLAAVPARGARVLEVGTLQIALFRTGENRVFALRDRCPHRGGPLSQGIVHGERVTCPMHDWVIDLTTGAATGADEGCTATFAVRVEADEIFVDVPEACTDVATGGAAPMAADCASERRRAGGPE